MDRTHLCRSAVSPLSAANIQGARLADGIGADATVCFRIAVGHADAWGAMLWRAAALNFRYSKLVRPNRAWMGPLSTKTRTYETSVLES